MFGRKGKVKVFVTESGNTLTSKQQFLDDIHNEIKMADKADCDVILGFCPVISRMGTDIEAALKAFTGFSKYIIVVVLHHTFDKQYVVPDNAKYRDKKTYIVNCLFHEDKGLLKNCALNTSAINQTKKYLEEIKEKIKQEQKEKKKRDKEEIKREKKEKKKEEKAKKKQEKKEKKKEEKKARL